MAFEFIKLSQEATDNLTSEEREALVKLSKNKDIIISKADKGNAVVIQNKSDYSSKVTSILNTGGKFSLLLKGDPTQLREKRLQNELRDLWKAKNGPRPKVGEVPSKKQVLDWKVYDRLLPCGSKAGVLYGLPKVHKSGTPIRPIISAVQTYNYKLAKYLVEILTPQLFNDDNDMLIDTFDFVNKVRDLDLAVDKHMVSFDVESLFTNIPTDETIEIILDKTHGPAKIPSDRTGKPIINREAQNKLFHGLRRDELKRFLVVCTKESHFQFDGKFYDQVDGVAMGSPLGPLFANVFMCNFVRKHRDHLTELGVRKWNRYVDDVFATVDDRTVADAALTYLNAQHPNIRFTIEHEMDNKLPFLDTLVVRGVDSYKTTIYRKKTFTGVYLNWTSLTTKRYKIGLIYCLLDRIWKICSDSDERDVQVEKLRRILERNEYPKFVVDREVEKFIKLRKSPPPLPSNELAPDDATKNRFIVLPYVSPRAEGFAKRLKLHVSSYFPQVDFNVAFKAPNEIGKFFPYKDRVTEITSRSLVVYRIRCGHPGCDESYIGKTERILLYRLKEHQHDKSSVCHQHEISTGHVMDVENVEVLDTADSDFKLRLKELLHIVCHRPSLNRQLNPQSQFNVNTLIIAAYKQVTGEVSTP